MPSFPLPDSMRHSLEEMASNPRLSLIHSFLHLFMHPNGHTETSPNLQTIPQYLLENRLVIPLDEYETQGGWSEKAKMFSRIATVAQSVKDKHEMTVPFPQVIPLTHHLWEEWNDNNQTFTPQTSQELTTFLTELLDRSPIVIRHLDDDGQNKDVGVHSYPGVTTVEDALEKIQTQYRHYRTLGWNEKGHEVDVAVGIYAHADPPTYQTINLENDILELSSGQPPIGFVVTTSQKGELVDVSLVIGDNLAGQEHSELCDIHHFSYTAPMLDGNFSLERNREPHFGSREAIMIDRDGSIGASVQLPPNMLNRPIAVSETELIRAAIFAAEGAKQFGYNVKVEGSLNQYRRVEINSLAEYIPKEKVPLDKYELQYQVLATVHSLSDIDSLQHIDPNSITYPPTIILDKEIKTSLEIGRLLQRIQDILLEKISTSEGTSKSCWGKALILASGGGLSHFLDPFLRDMATTTYTADVIPPNLPGDILVFEPGRNPNEIWIRNRNLSGDGDLVVAPKYWAQSFPASKIGSKAAHHHEAITRNQLSSPEHLVLTDIAFMQILEANGVLQDYESLLTGNGNTPIKKIFTNIRDNLKFIPPELKEQVWQILKRLVPNYSNSFFMARSDTPMEDIGDIVRYAGSFDSLADLKLELDGDSGLEYGILAVIKSLFTDELADYLLSIKDVTDRKKALTNWTMPVKIDAQVDAIVSGVAVALDASTRNQNYFTIQAQAGRGGVVDGEKEGRPILTVKAKRGTRHIISMTVKYLGQDPITLNSPKEISDHFPPELTLPWIVAIMNSTDKVDKSTQLRGIEWAIDHPIGKLPRLWHNQAR